MARTLVKTTHDTVTTLEALQMINNQSGSNFLSVTLAIAALGIGVATTFFSGGLSVVVVATLNSFGISLGVSAVLSVLQSSYQTQLSNAINQLRSNSYIIVTTRVYENYGGSGNSYWHSTEHSFTVHHDSN